MIAKKMGVHPSRQNIKVAVDNCIFTITNNELNILLIQMKKKPYERIWALPGGLIKDGETTDAASARVLEEETSVSDVYLEQLYTFSRSDRDPFGRVISVAYMALIPSRNVKLKTIPKYTQVNWWKFRDLPKLAYDHNEIAKYAMQRLKWKMEYTNIVWSFLPRQFSLSDLQNIYESVLGRSLDKRNFRKKILGLGLIESAGEKELRGAHRPAQLYKFKNRKHQIVEIL